MSNSPNPQLHAHFLKSLSKCITLSHLKQLQAHVTVLGHSHTQLFSFKLLRFAAVALSNIPYSRLIFDSQNSPNVYLYTAMITAHTAWMEPVPALHLFKRMVRDSGADPNEFIYPHVLKCCVELSDFGLLKSVETRIRKTGFEGYSVVMTALLDGYSRCGDIKTACALFDELPTRNAVSWTTMIFAYMRVGSIGNALCLFEEMPVRDVPSWNAMIAGCGQNGYFMEAFEFFRRMVLDGAHPSPTSVVCVLSACGHLGMLQHAKSMHGYVCKNQIGSSPFVSNALIDMYGKCGRLKAAKWIFDTFSDRSLTAWNSMVNCLALHGESTEAIAMFERMRAEGVHPDEVTFVGLLNACAHGGLVDEGYTYFESMTQNYGFEAKISHYGCIIDLLARAGRFKDVLETIKYMKKDADEVVWGSLLNGARIHRNKEMALLATKKLLEKYPESADYRVMLANLYSECGDWEEVRKVRRLMDESGNKKLPGCSWIEVDGEVQQFYSGDKTHPLAEEICKVLEGLG